MPLNPSGPISIGGSTVGQSINLELGRAATATSSLNDSALRSLAGVPSGQISLSNFYGKSNAFSFNLSGSNVNLRSSAVAAGWDQTSQVIATITSGTTISSTGTGTPALTINGSFPNGVSLINGGIILGRGGNGGNGANAPGGGASSPAGGTGNIGGAALAVSVPVTINNTSGFIRGGGGGGGGGGGRTYVNRGAWAVAGGGGGGGIGTSSGGPGGTASSPNGAPYFRVGNPGSGGTATTVGSGGTGGSLSGPYFIGTGGTGGAGGNFGSGGASGNPATGNTGGPGAGGGGGAAGPAVTGNSFVTWNGTGTRTGPIS